MLGSLFLWGLLALLQIVFLPGHLLVRALRLRLGIVDGLLVTFGLSTLVNYIAIQFLVLFHVFKHPVMLGIIVFELLVLLLLWRRGETNNRWHLSAGAYRDSFTAWQSLIAPGRAVVMGIALFALFCTFALAHSAASSWQDEAFTLWDNVMSWNRWATEWCENRFPWKTYHYPQLLPANSSIIYLLSGTTAVQAFNRLFFAFFPIAILLCLLDLGVRRRQVGFWLSIPFIYFAWIFMARPLPAEGYADVPVTFMILMAIYSILLADEQHEAGSKVRWMITAGLFTGAALVTKQTGVLIILTLPVFLALIADSQKILAPRQKRKAILGVFALAILISVPWYLLKEIQIRTGVDQSEITGAVVAHGGRDLTARIQYGVHEMFTTWGTAQTIIVASLAMVAAFLRTPWRWVARLIVLPGFLVWAITTSYDLRNSNFCVVLGCVSAGVAAGHMLASFSALWRPWPLVWRNVTAAALVTILFFILSFLPSVSNSNLLFRSDQTQKTTAVPELNAEIFRLIAEQKITRPVITNYWMMFFIPGLKEFMTYDSLMDVDAFKNSVERTNAEYIVILHPSQNYPAVSEQTVSAHIGQGLWSVEKTGGAFQIIKIHSRPLLPPPEKEKNDDASKKESFFGGFKVISGLGPEEGPYPQWNLPIVRWGLAPSTKFEFHANDGEIFELSLDIVRPVKELTLEILLNGTAVAQSTVTVEPTTNLLKFPITARLGINKLEINYSAWDGQSETRPLAVLFRSIRLLPKRP